MDPVASAHHLRSRPQLEALLAKAELDMREGRIMGAEFYRLKHEIGEKIRLLDRIARGDKLRETMYEDEVEDIEQLRTKVLEPVPKERRRKPTQLEVLHNIAKHIKMSANKMLAISEWTQATPTEMREHLQFIALRCYLYHRALGQNRGRDLLYVDRKNPEDMRLSDNLGFVHYYIKLHSQFWSIEPAKTPSEVRAEKKQQQASGQPSKLSRSERRKANRAARRLQEQEKAADDSAQQRRQEQKAKRFEADGIPLYEPATAEEKQAMSENSLKVLKRAMKAEKDAAAK